MAAPAKRQCRLCGRNDLPENMIRVGTTESKPGWCGGPRQGGRPVFMHQPCIEAQVQRDAAAVAKREAALAAARAYLAECTAAGVDPDPNRFGDLLEG